MADSQAYDESEESIKPSQSTADEWSQATYPSQFVPFFNAPPSTTESTLLHPPPNIRAVRDAVFLLKQSITWTGPQYSQYWAFVDNLWVHNQTRAPNKDGIQISYYYCRLWKDSQVKTKGQGLRNKKMRIADPCPMKMKLCKHFVSSELQTAVFSLHASQKNPCSQHNHSIEYVDILKVNSGVKNTVAAEVSKGYVPSAVNRNLQGIKWSANKTALEEAGGVHMNLKGVHNAAIGWKRSNPDARIRGGRMDWEDQWEDCIKSLEKEGVLVDSVTAMRKTDNDLSHGTVFATPNRIGILTRRGHLVLMDSTHKTNHLDWKLFSLLIRDEHAKWVPCAHMLSDNEDGDIVAAFLILIKRWCGGAWNLRYIITDDSAAEQRAVSLAFQGLIHGELKPDHFLCRTHSERTLHRTLGADSCKAAKKHLYDALYFRQTSMGCDQSIEAAIKAAPESKRAYIRREWLETKQQWAYYARQHSCLLLQCMTTNAVESWHKSIKSQAEGKGSMSKFSLIGCAQHVLKIADQWEQRAEKAAVLFRTTRTPECADYPDLALFPGPVQSLLIEQLKEAIKNIDEGEPPKSELGDELICQCKFYRSYQLPCRHLFQYNLVNNVITTRDWQKWASMFEDGGFEIYESTTKTYAVNEIYETIDGPSRHVLEMREVLDHVKTRFYEIEEITAGWDDVERKNNVIKLWLNMLKQLVGPVRRQGAVQALKELEDEGHHWPDDNREGEVVQDNYNSEAEG